MNNKKVYPKNLHPASLTEQEILNPRQVIYNFFDAVHLRDHLETLKHWRDLVLTNKCFSKCSSPADLLLRHTLTQRLVDAAWLLRKERHKFPADINGIETQITLVTKAHSKLIGYPCTLSDKEILNPYKVFKGCFNTYSLSEYRNHMYQWLEEGLSNLSSPENCDAKMVIAIYENLQRLYMAAYLINEQTFKMNNHE